MRWLDSSLTVDEIREAVYGLTLDEAQRILYDWRGFFARDNQLLPSYSNEWAQWLILAGRGFGKTRTGVEAVREVVEQNRTDRIALVAPTSADCRDVVVKGESGILAVFPPERRPIYEPSKRLVTFHNGAVAFCYSGEEPERLRGPQHGFAYLDEVVVYPDPQALWDNLTFGLRLGADPRAVVTTTPKPTAFLRQLVADSGTLITRGSTFDNAENLPPRVLARFKAVYGGTTVGRQELYGELLEEAEGALWKRANIEALRVKSAPQLIRVVVAIDPSVTSTATSDECGVIGAGLGTDGHGYVLADRSCRLPPAQWAHLSVSLFDQINADRIIAEVNNGGDLVEAVIRTERKSIAYKKITASRGKVTRAEPIAALYEQGKIHHVGGFADLEDEMCNFVPGALSSSPNRCFIAGTQIQTEHGEKPIEAVMVGDRVWTRVGLRPVTAAGMVDDSAEVMTLILSDGRRLTGTPDHPIFIQGKGFSRMDALVWGDILEVWPDAANASSLMGGSITDTRTPSSGIHECTIEHSAAMESAPLCSIGISGSRLTGQSQRATISTTQTKTRSITIQAIWSALRSASTRADIPLFRSRNCWRESARLLPNGTDQRKDWPGIRSMVSTLGRFVSQFWLPVSFAANHLKVTFPIGYASVPVAACGSITNEPESITRLEFASPAAANSLLRNPKNRPAVPVSVAGSCAPNRAPVYNLTVSGAHEYYANGVLVHNCDALVWAFTELMLKPEVEGLFY